ncbi:MAG: hypothetical protein AAF211_14095, partial [Myxococcota bacterium]
MDVFEGWSVGEDAVALYGVDLRQATDGAGVRHVLLVPADARATEGAPDLPVIDGIAPVVRRDAATGTVAYLLDDGELLADVAPGPWDVEAALDLLLALGRVLDAAARVPQLGAHGAVDPWRIVLHPRGAVSVLGYGQSPSGPPAAGPAARFVAPEVRGGALADVRSDVFAAGLCVVERLRGEALPEPCERVADALADVVLSPPTLRTLLLDCVDDDPAARPANGAELVQRARAVRDPALPPPRRARRRSLLGWLGRALAREWAVPYENLVARPRRRRAIAARTSVAAEEVEACHRGFADALEVVTTHLGADSDDERGLRALEPRLAALDAAAERVGEAKSEARAEQRANEVRQLAADFERDLQLALHEALDEGPDPDPAEHRARALDEATRSLDIVTRLAEMAHADVAQARAQADGAVHDERVERTLARLDELMAGYTRDREEAEAFVVQLEQADAEVPAGSPWADQAHERRQQVDDLLEQLAVEVQAVESASQAFDDAQETMAHALSAVAEHLTRAREASERVRLEADTHPFARASVDAAVQQLAASVDQVVAVEAELDELAEALGGAGDAAEARRLARKAEELRGQAVSGTEAVADAEGAALAALARSQQEFRDNTRRQLEAAVEEGRRVFERVAHVAERLESAVARAAGPDDAVDLSGWDHGRIWELEQAVADVGKATELSKATELVRTAEALAEQIERDADLARDEALAVLDAARAAAADAKTRKRVLEELRDHGPQADAALEQLQAAREQLGNVLSEAKVPFDFDDRSDDLASSALAAVAEVSQLAQNADSDDLPAAQARLGNSRDAVRKVTEAADAMTAMLGRAVSARDAAEADADARQAADARMRAS